MNKFELRHLLRKKKKTELNDLINIFSQECPHFKIKLETKLDKETLASRVWVGLINLKVNFPEPEFTLCMEILAKLENKMESSEDANETQLPYDQTIKYIPFSANEIINYLFSLIKHNETLLEKINDRKFHGFKVFLRFNDITILETLETILYNKVFDETIENLDISENDYLEYARHRLDVTENVLKDFFTRLNDEEIDIILSLNLLFHHILEALESENVKINYTYDDIPLLKRAFVAQYLNFFNDGELGDDDLDKIVCIINNIIQMKVTDLIINTIPWTDLE